MKHALPILVASIMASACAHAQEPRQPVAPAGPPVTAEVVHVTGEAVVNLSPDRVVFNLGVETFAPNVTDAVRENNQKVAAVIDALKAAGATAAEIRTSNYSIYPRQEYREGRQPRIVGYQVNNSITVRNEDPAAASRLLEAAINAGANTASGLSMVVSDPAAGQSEGLKRAFDNARAKAETMAAAAGRTIGRAVSISEGATTPPPVPRMYAARAEMAQEASVGEVPVAAGTQERRFVVTVVFELM